jgi:hypothetical protein
MLDRLARIYSFQDPPDDPLALILWENIGYLIDDSRRDELFREFGKRVGLDAAKIARAPDAVLLDIARRGGMRLETRVERCGASRRLSLPNAAAILMPICAPCRLPRRESS